MTVGIIGLGLIGGSMARAYALEGHTVYACETDDQMLSFAMLAGAVHGVLSPETISCCDLILLAIYPEGTARWLEEHAEQIPTDTFYDFHGFNMGFGYMAPSIAVEAGYAYSWSLLNYKTAVSENAEDAYAELERSIVAKLADDIMVGVRGKNVEIVVKKAF